MPHQPIKLTKSPNHPTTQHALTIKQGALQLIPRGIVSQLIHIYSLAIANYYLID